MDKKTILIVEDEIDLQEALQKKLEEGGFEVKKAGDGFEFIDLIKKDGIDLVLLDVLMPTLQGIDALEEVRKFAIEKKIAKKGEKVVVVAGVPFNTHGVETNLMLVETV